MNLDEAKILVPAYLDNELNVAQTAAFEALLAIEDELREEVRLFQKSWQILTEYPQVEPQPGFESRLYTRLATEVQPVKHWWQTGWAPWRLVPVAVGLSLVVAWVVFLMPSVGNDLTLVSEADLEIIENYELVESFDILEDFEFWLDLETMERESVSAG